MKLIQQLKPFTTRVEVVKLPVKNCVLFGFSESDNHVFDVVWNDESPIVGSFVGFFPANVCKIHIPTSQLQEIKKRYSKKPIYLNTSFTKSQRSCIVDLSYVTDRLKKKGLTKPYLNRFVEFTQDCIKSLTETFANYDYKYIYDVIDLSQIPSALNKQSLRMFNIYPILALLESDEAFKDWFDETIGKIFVTLKLPTNSYLNVLVYDSQHKSFGNISTVIPRFINLLKLMIRDSKQDDVVDRKVSQLMKNVTRFVPNKKIHSIIKQDLNSYANKYPDEVVIADPNNENEAKKIYAKAVKAVVTNDSDVKDDEVNEIIENLTQIQIESLQIPDKITNEDKLSPIRKSVTPPQIGNITESRKKAFENLENFVKIYNVYFKRLGFKILSVERKPIEVRDIAKTEQEELLIRIEDLETGKIHEIELLIPRIIDDNYFYVQGVKRVLIHQLFPLPVVSYRSGEVLIRTNFANATVTLETRFKTKSFYAVVLGKKLPVILLFIIYHGSLGNTLKAFDIEFEESENIQESSTYYKLPNGKHLVIKNSLSPEKKLLLDGLKLVKKWPENDTLEEWLSVLSNMITQRFASQIQDYLDRFIDPLTYYVLVTENLPETVDGLFWYACQLAYSGIVTSQTDLRYRRIRSVEVFALLIYKRLYFELYKYRLQTEMSTGSSKKSTIKIPKDAILKDLVTTDAVSQYQNVNAINPVIESSFITRVTYAGYSGIKSENVPMSMRNVDPTYFGTICPVDTPECLDVDTIVYKYDETTQTYIPTRIADIQVGDKIQGSDGKPKTVVKKFLTYKIGYLVKLDDSTVIICSDDHRFYVYDTKSKRKKYKVLALKDIMKDPKRYKFVSLK